MFRRCILLCFFMLVVVNLGWSADMDEATLRGILKRSDTTLIVYVMLDSRLTTIPMTAERMRGGSYDCKLAISINDSSIARQLAKRIIEARMIDDDIDSG